MKRVLMKGEAYNAIFFIASEIYVGGFNYGQIYELPDAIADYLVETFPEILEEVQE